jgi:hypothetical protein
VVTEDLADVVKAMAGNGESGKEVMALLKKREKITMDEKTRNDSLYQYIRSG